MIFNINKLRSWGLRYLVCDEAGQIWAHRDMPIRVDPSYSAGYWRIPDKFLAPKVSTASLEADWRRYREHWANMMCMDLVGKRVCAPISDCPVAINWEDEPYDMLEHGLFA